jgi:hypothetical protein
VRNKEEYIRKKSIIALENDDSEKDDGNQKIEVLEGAADENTLMALNDNLNKSLSSLIPPSYYEEELVFSQNGDIKLQGNTNFANEHNEEELPYYEDEAYEDELIVLPVAFSKSNSRRNSIEGQVNLDSDNPTAIVIDYASRSESSSITISGERYRPQEQDSPTAIVIDYAAKSDDSSRGSSGGGHINQGLDSPSGVIMDNVSDSGSGSRRNSFGDEMNRELDSPPTAIVIDYAKETYGDNERDSYWEHSCDSDNEPNEGYRKEGYREDFNASRDQYERSHRGLGSEGIIQNTHDGTISIIIADAPIYASNLYITCVSILYNLLMSVSLF